MWKSLGWPDLGYKDAKDFPIDVASELNTASARPFARAERTRV